MKALPTCMYARKRQLGDTADGLVLKRQLSMFWVSGDCWQAVLCGLLLRTTAGGCWAVAPGGSKAGGAAFALVPQPAGACARVLSCKYSLGKATPDRGDTVLCSANKWKKPGSRWLGLYMPSRPLLEASE